jgi:hypothetical protein
MMMIAYDDIPSGNVNVCIKNLKQSVCEKIKKDLTISTAIMYPETTRVLHPGAEQHAGRPPHYMRYIERSYLFTQIQHYISIPRAYARQASFLLDRIDTRALDELRTLREMKCPDIRMRSILRPDQIQAAQEILRCIRAVYGACVCAPCGFGKTVTALSLICDLRMYALIIVNTEVMERQWRARIEEHMEGDTDQAIEICTIQAFLHSNAPSRITQTPGIIVVDEAHFLPARMFSQVLSSSPIYPGCCYRIALTATPEREDNRHLWLFSHFGPIAFRGVPRIVPGTVYVVVRNGNQYEGYNYTSIMLAMSRDEARNDALLGCIDHALEEPRAILVLSLYTSHLDNIQKQWDIRRGEDKSCHMYTMYGANRTLPDDGQIIAPSITFATYALAKQGLDCPRLDTLILALPCKNVTQAVGRIMRRDPDHGARIYDIYDLTPVCRLGQRKRSEYYREQLKRKVESFQRRK